MSDKCHKCGGNLPDDKRNLVPVRVDGKVIYVYVCKECG